MDDSMATALKQASEDANSIVAAARQSEPLAEWAAHAAQFRNLTLNLIRLAPLRPERLSNPFCAMLQAGKSSWTLLRARQTRTCGGSRPNSAPSWKAHPRV